jgi:hypothetical protein
MHELYAQSKQLITSLLLLVDNILKVTSFICPAWSSTFGKTVKNSAQQLLICGHTFIPIIVLQLLCCVQTIPVYAFFEVSPYKEIREPAVRRPHRPWDTQNMKMLLSLINTLHTPQMHYHKADFKRHDIFSC